MTAAIGDLLSGPTLFPASQRVLDSLRRKSGVENTDDHGTGVDKTVVEMIGKLTENDAVVETESPLVCNPARLNFHLGPIEGIVESKRGR